MPEICTAAPQPVSTERVFSEDGANPVEGRVAVRPVKMAWIVGMTAVALIGGPLTFSWAAFGVFVVLSAITICGGHSVGMHRLLIHRSFKAVPWVERLLVYLGVLVGMAGPCGMIRLHDFRDWGQRQADCHEFFAHRAGFWKDAYWQLCCGIDLKQEPRFEIEPEIAEDPFYRQVEKTWMAQQLVIAVPLYLLGGLPFVVWGVCCRVSVSLIGHWLVGYYAHQPKDHLLFVKGACVQGYNLPRLGLITFGEAFHENHHAFPNSAKLGLLPGQIDLGWWLVKYLEKAGFVWGVKTPEMLEARCGLTVNRSSSGLMLPEPSWLQTIPKASTQES